MAKKVVKQVKTVIKESSKEAGKDTISLIVENSIALQKVVTELAVNMKHLSREISELLELFREATKTIASEKLEEEVKKEEIAELKGKIDEMIEQNKTIARGILLLESTLSPKEKYPNY